MNTSKTLINNIFSFKLANNLTDNFFVIFSTSLILLLFSLFFPTAVFSIILITAFLVLLALFPEYLLYLLAFSIPLVNLYIPVEFLNLHYFGFIKDFKLPIVDLIAISLFFGFLLRSVFNKIFSFDNEKLKMPVLLAFLGFFIISLLSAINAHNWFASIWYSVRWIAVFYFIYILLPVNLIKDKKILRNTIISFVLSAIYVSLMGMASLLYQDFGNDFVRFKPIGIFRIYPIGYNQKQISEILIVGTMFILALRHWFNGVLAKRTIFFTWIVFMIILVGSFSRAAWLIAGLQILFLLYEYRHTVKRYQTESIIGIMIFIALFLAPAYYMFSIQTDAPGLGSNKHRALLSTIAWKGFTRHPILGHGSGDFFYLVDNSIRYTATSASLMDSHGIWQKISAEMGLLGLTAFIIFVAAIINFIWQRYRIIDNSKDRKLLIYIIVAVLSIFLFEWFDTSFYRGKIWLPVGIMIATAYILSNKQKHENITD